MGLFILEQSDEPIDLIQAAIANIHLFLGEREGQDMDYLLKSFAITQLKQAEKRLKDMPRTVASVARQRE